MTTSTGVYLSFRGQPIGGVVTRFKAGAPENHAFRTHFAGIDGVSEIYGGTGARSIEAAIVLFGACRTRDILRQFIDGTLNGSYLGANGPLIYAGKNPTYNRTYPDCTFEGFDQQSDDLHDDAGLLDGLWFCMGLLTWTQLSAND